VNVYRIRALVDERRQIERDVEALTVFGAVSLVTIDLWDDVRQVSALSVWLLGSYEPPWQVSSNGCVTRSEH